MTRIFLLIASGLLFLGFAVNSASAASAAVATADVNMRAGPSTAYPVVTVVPQGAAIVTFGCVADYSWCDVGFAGKRGWVSAHYMQVVWRGAPVVVKLLSSTQGKGVVLAETRKAAEALSAKGITPTIADARFAKPLDREMILQLAADHEALITIEEGAVGGFGSHVAQLLSDEGIFDRGFKFRSMVLPDDFIDQASPKDMYEAAAMNAPQIEAKVLEVLGVVQIGERRA